MTPDCSTPTELCTCTYKVHCTACATCTYVYMYILVVIKCSLSLIYWRWISLFFLTGPLTSVLNLETDSGRSLINVSWEAPFTLDVTDEDPDIWYSVLIYNMTDEENPTTVPCTDCHNLTQTHYVFIPDYPSPCHKYTFTIIPHNGVGEGETSQNITGYSINSETGFMCTCINAVHTIFTPIPWPVSLLAVMCSIKAYKFSVRRL